MTKFMSTSESFFDYNFLPSTVVKDNSNDVQDDASDSEYEELHQQIYFEKRRRLKPLADKFSQWRRNIRNAVGRLRDARGTSEDGSRPTSAMSYNSSYSGGRSSPGLEVIDFIDDNYLSLRRRVHVYHHHLRRVFAHLNNALKRGPPLGGRLDALKSTFKVGAVDQFPEEALAKCFSDFCLDLTNEGQLALSLRDSSNAFSASATLRQSLVKTARSGFLAPLTEFLTRDWREICVKDKSLTQLAKRIQKAKIEAKLSQAEINGMMSQFAIRREDVVSNFEYILRSEIPLTKRLINLIEAYKAYYFENARVFHELETALRTHLGQPPPERLWLYEAEKETEAEESAPEIPLTSKNDAPVKESDEAEKIVPDRSISNNGGHVPSLGNGDGAMTMGHLLLSGGGDGASAKKTVWESRNLAPIAGSTTAYCPSARAYGFVRTAYSGSGAEDLNLAVGDLVYLDTKLEDAETKRLWASGEVAVGCEKRAGLFPLDVVEVILDL